MPWFSFASLLARFSSLRLVRYWWMLPIVALFTTALWQKWRLSTLKARVATQTEVAQMWEARALSERQDNNSLLSLLNAERETVERLTTSATALASLEQTLIRQSEATRIVAATHAQGIADAVEDSVSECLDAPVPPAVLERLRSLD